MFEHPGQIVYGALVIGALLDAESARSETYADTVGGVVVAMLLLWLAHAYSVSTAHRLTKRERLSPTIVGNALADEAWILVGGLPSLITVLIAWWAGGRLGNAVTAAVWTSVAAIVLIELLAAISAKLPAQAFVIQLAFGGLLGLGIIVLKAVLHG
jgi:hypothetical protein